MSIRFNQLLEAQGVDPTDVTILIHNTRSEPMRRLLPSMVFERPDVFDAYQSVHSGQVTATLRGRGFVASFVPVSADRMIFVGLYDVMSHDPVMTSQIYADPRFQVIADDFGDAATAMAIAQASDAEQTVFRMQLRDELRALRGRLQIEVPGGRAYARLAENLDPIVTSVTEAPVHATPAPDWDAFVVSAVEVRSLPASWRARLREWRGVYLIVDERDGARYVGAAYGADNLLGRWRDHIAGEHGTTVNLQDRDPTSFRFSILELVAPTATPDDVLACEGRWKIRLHTRRFGLNAN